MDTQTTCYLVSVLKLNFLFIHSSKIRYVLLLTTPKYPCVSPCFKRICFNKMANASVSSIIRSRKGTMRLFNGYRARATIYSLRFNSFAAPACPSQLRGTIKKAEASKIFFIMNFALSVEDFYLDNRFFLGKTDDKTVHRRYLQKAQAGIITASCRRVQAPTAWPLSRKISSEIFLGQTLNSSHLAILISI